MFIYFCVNEILRNLIYRSINEYIISLLTTSILGLFIFIIPYIYILNYFSQVEGVQIKKTLFDLIVIGIYYFLFWLLFKPYPGDYIDTSAIICTTPTLRMLFIVLILILPIFLYSIYKENNLTKKDILCSGIFSVVFQYLIIQILVIGTIIWLNIEIFLKKWDSHSYNLAIGRSLLVNYRYFFPLLFLIILLTLCFTVLFVRKKKRRILYNKKLGYSAFKISLNSLFIIFVILLIQKKTILMWIVYLTLLAIIHFNSKRFSQWFNEYINDALSNTIEIFFIGFFYSLDQPSKIQDYIKEDFVKALIALLVLYMVIIIWKTRTKKEES